MKQTITYTVALSGLSEAHRREMERWAESNASDVVTTRDDGTPMPDTLVMRALVVHGFPQWKLTHEAGPRLDGEDGTVAVTSATDAQFHELLSRLGRHRRTASGAYQLGSTTEIAAGTVDRILSGVGAEPLVVLGSLGDGPGKPVRAR